MEAFLKNLLSDGPATQALKTLTTILVILLLSAGLHLLLVKTVLRVVSAFVRRTRGQWDDILSRRRFFHRLAALAPGLLALALAEAWLTPGNTPTNLMRVAAYLWMLLVGLRCLFSLLDSLGELYNTRPYARQMPLQGFIQGVKLVAFSVVVIVAISLLMGKSPTLLVSGLGAMTAILMLVFKDPILGFVAGIQLAANRMLSVGDWLEMPKYQADGDVTDITLTTVKVRNWDQTITTVPTYALISDSFKNWRGMQEAGGRRIMRSLFVDMHSVRFLAEEDIERLRKAQLITEYIDAKLREIETSNREQKVDPSSPVNGRHLTNLGTFRAYLLAYLQAHPGIKHDLITMVRQLQPTSAGIPLEIYAFTNSTAWPVYEGVQADILDHVLAVVPEFGLRVFQAPSGSDVRALQTVGD